MNQLEVTYEDVIAELKTQITDSSYQNAVLKAQLKKAHQMIEANKINDQKGEEAK